MILAVSYNTGYSYGAKTVYLESPSFMTRYFKNVQIIFSFRRFIIQNFSEKFKTLFGTAVAIVALPQDLLPDVLERLYAERHYQYGMRVLLFFPRIFI